ncbi:DNA polymerase III subunit delta' [Isobaculum melis]|uniref:DNA polymerase III, delta prime subunit n=1 Tax=Isobaculum melis TaxID=142588 RepID=A0A1H9SP91_9LACT|nr:DNA polymerase III, delta prime subunit [Isobaculum melis]
MVNNEIKRLQPQLTEQFKASVKHGQLAHAYLFEGEPGTGKKAMAKWLAMAKFCEEQLDDEPCGVCHNCLRIQAEEHPDVMIVAPDGLSIKVDQVRELKTAFSKTGVEGSQKIFIVEDVEKMTVGAANSLLKFLEEPDGSVSAFLLTTAKQKILPTILSRCQVVTFFPLAKKDLLKALEAAGINPAKGALWVHLTNNFQTAVEMEQDEWFNEAKQIIWKLFQNIASGDYQGFIMIQTHFMPHFKEREQQLIGLDMLVYLYRDLLMLSYGTAQILAYPTKEQELQRIIEKQTGTKTNMQLAFILKAKRKLESNVGAQGVFEQLVLQLIKS